MSPTEIHLPLLFVILGVGFAAGIVAWIVAGAFGLYAVLHMDDGPQWPNKLAIPVTILTFIVAAYFLAKLT